MSGNASDDLRRRIWRCVRDAGVKGLPRARVAERFRAFDADYVGRILDGLKAGNYVAKSKGRGGVFRVIEKNRAPNGETLVLGPGHDDEPDDDEQQDTAPGAGARLGPSSVFALADTIAQGYRASGPTSGGDQTSPESAAAPRHVSQVDQLATWRAARPAPREAAARDIVETGAAA